MVHVAMPIFFKVVALRPSRWHVVDVPLVRRYQSSDVVIAVHTLVDGDGAGQPCVNLRPAQVCILRSFVGANFEALRDQFYCYAHASLPVCFCSGIDAGTQLANVLERLLIADGVGLAPQPADEETLRALRLQQLSWQDQTGRWHLTEHGRGRMGYKATLSGQRLVCNSRPLEGTRVPRV